MRFWFAPQSDVPLYRQLATQVQLAILSGELRHGDRLPSTRELARRFAIHPNTVSAGYRQLERDGWTELRPGSGVYVCEPAEPSLSPETQLDAHIGRFFREAREAGLPLAALRGRLSDWLSAPPPDHWLLVDPDPDLRRILLTELRALTRFAVREVSLEGCAAWNFSGAVACCRPSQAKLVRAHLPIGTELVILPITSATQSLGSWLPAPTEHLIAVVSHWPEFLTTARTMLAAAGVPADCLLFRDARQSDWDRGLLHVSGIVCDVYTAKSARLPRETRLIVFPLLATQAREVLQLATL